MITFRPLVAGDLPRLHRWLNDPEVVRWWEGDDVTWAGVLATYGSTARDPQEHSTAVLDGRPLGWIQHYGIADEPEDLAFFAPLQPHPSAATIDYLIGDPARRGRGLGTAMIRAFVADVVFARRPQCEQVWVAPQLANAASWRALAGAGFRQVADVPSDLGLCRAMVMQRPAVL